MKKILVPTDFSESANSALNYAIELAKREHAEILLLHTYHVNYANTYTLLATETEKAKEESDSKLLTLALRIEHAGDIKYEILSKEDLAVDAILKTIEEENIDLVVMGTKGATGLKEVFVGSNTARVTEKAKCPVIAVPEGASGKVIKYITYATDYRHSDFIAIEKLVEIARPFDAQINFLHVASEGKQDNTELMELFMNEVIKKIDYTNISYQVIDGNNVAKKLEEYLNDGKTDLLVMSTHQRHLMDKLFERSITKRLIYHSRVPLLTFHYEKEEIYIT